MNDYWNTSLGTRYDFETQRAASTTWTLGYRNECIQLGAFVTRSFSSASVTEPDMGFGFSLEFVGFGAGAAPPPRRRACVKGLKG